ncbi:hypothetical protein H4R18_004403 [Coemansia javaensis]|uniref:Calcium-activated potassium channel BK alpha subunit domain-containing protein n=1 Tax=Coemansia javaensis TaxID=2761396 RepID=A0A9W8H7V6_9FUNG|nr:hypothetical protein H4R18_004403 [Coemansia javaensis]
MPEQATFVTLDSIVNGWRQRVLYFIDTSIWGQLWDLGDFALNVGLCIVYIVNTTVIDAGGDPGRLPAASRLVEFLLVAVFLGQYVVRYVVINANHRSLEHAAAAFTAIPPITAYFLSIRNATIRASYMSAGVMAIFYPARFLRLHYAIKRALAIAASMRYVRLTMIRQEVILLSGDIVVAILFFASLVHSGVNWYCQANHIDHERFSFLDTIYSIVTSALGQNGQIPMSTFYQVITMVILALIALAVPSRISRLVELAVNTSTYTKAAALPAATRHALLCGHIEVGSTRQFLQEFFNADHGPNIFKTTIVILDNKEPSMEMKALLRRPQYANRVFYVKGRATSLKALRRARVDLATCVYILTRKAGDVSGIDEDGETVLIALALSVFSTPFVRRGRDEALPVPPRFQVFAQTMLPGTIAHLAYLQTTRAVCVDEMRLGIMAQNCATPGFAALAFMLSTTVTNRDDWDFSGVFTEDLAVTQDDGWVKSYIHGMNQEIYQAHVPHSLVGVGFFKAARYFYRCHGLLLVGVGSYSAERRTHDHISHHPAVDADGGCYEVLLAPRCYALQQYDILFAVSTDVQSVLGAVGFAERVSIKSTHVKPAKARPSHIPLRMVMPLQADHPRRLLGRGAPARANYISDSDSSYFSPALLDTAVAGRGAAAAEDAAVAEAQPGPERTGRVARRHDSVPGALSGHIVVCDSGPAFPRSMDLLVAALRGAFGSALLPVVVLSPGEADAQQRQALAELGAVYVVRGTPLAQADLARARIRSAQRAIVLSSRAPREGETGDSPAILANMNIQQACGTQFFVTTELTEMESVRYLDHTQLLGSPLLKRTFMGGHVFVPALLDTALCQCYFSSHILDVLRRLTFSHAGGGSAAACRPGRLSLLYVPPRFVGKRYDTLALTLMKQHTAVPLGLYRVVAARAQNFAAVMCNPRPDTPLVAADAVYVLGPAIAGWTHPQPHQQQPHQGSSAGPGTGTTTSQSRHTVYSHNVSTTPKTGAPSVDDNDDDDDDHDDGADADVSDDCGRPENMA